MEDGLRHDRRTAHRAPRRVADPKKSFHHLPPPHSLLSTHYSPHCIMANDASSSSTSLPALVTPRDRLPSPADSTDSALTALSRTSDRKTNGHSDSKEEDGEKGVYCHQSVPTGPLIPSLSADRFADAGRNATRKVKHQTIQLDVNADPDAW
jgi:hypothetical protein